MDFNAKQHVKRRPSITSTTKRNPFFVSQKQNHFFCLNNNNCNNNNNINNNNDNNKVTPVRTIFSSNKLMTKTRIRETSSFRNVQFQLFPTFQASKNFKKENPSEVISKLFEMRERKDSLQNIKKCNSLIVKRKN